MPEEPQTADQYQPLIQPQSQPLHQTQPQPLSQFQPTPRPEPITVNFQPIIPPVNVDNKPVESVQSAYAPQPQFVSDLQATAPIDTQTEPSIANSIFSQSQPVPVEKKSKKGIIIAAVAAGVLLTFGGGSTFAYNVWYSNPNKVISDAIIKAIIAKNPIYVGKLTTDSSDLKTLIEITSKQLDATGSLDAKVKVTASGKDFELTGGAIFDKAGDLYFRVGGIKTAFEDYATASHVIVGGIDEFITKVDNKWVKISNEDLNNFNKSFVDSKKCVNNTIEKFKGDNSALTEISDLYIKNTFIKINKELGQKNGSFGYEIEPDNAKAKTFLEGFKSTKIYTEIHSCDSKFTISPEDIIPTVKKNDVNIGKLELWVNSWSHEITKIKATSTSSSSTKYEISIEPLYNQVIKIDTPTNSISFAELTAAIDKMLQSATQDQTYNTNNYSNSAGSYNLMEVKNNLLSRKLKITKKI